MRISLAGLSAAVGVTLTACCAMGQAAPASVATPVPAATGTTAAVRVVTSAAHTGLVGTAVSAPTAAMRTAAPSGIQEMLNFRPSDVKFALPELMDILRDRRHEGWVLAAYPDPKTGRPLIGAGFSLDLPERAHAQTDPLNPHPFVEPSSAQLWTAAGLDPENLTTILSTYAAERARWKPRVFRRRIAGLAPEISDEQAEALLRIAAIQAIENAKAYCRNFDAMTASQQMAVSQLVYQMGVNLAEFSQFLAMVNTEAGTPGTNADDPGVDAAASGGEPNWQAVQRTLIQSQWARLYRTRAIAVIAMLDPQYADAPDAAERRIAATLRPAVRHRRQRRGAPSLQVASYSRHVERPGRVRTRRRTKKA